MRRPIRLNTTPVLQALALLQEAEATLDAAQDLDLIDEERLTEYQQAVELYTATIKTAAKQAEAQTRDCRRKIRQAKEA